ncbi:RNA-binding CRS1 / YhbY (CRM) domain protein [Euphorbia peplus]|nr:RNA-binding CRS1 / YhbY (CRM) domain protein [Euphorbia peplus]
MAKPLFRILRSATSLIKPSSSIRPIFYYPESVLPPSSLTIPVNLSNTLGALRNLSHGNVNLVISEGKPKFAIHELDPPKKEKWQTKKRLKMQRKRDKEKRKAANRRDPRCLTVKRKRKPKFASAEERIKSKLERARIKETLLIERLKRYEVAKVQGPEEHAQEIARLSGGIPIQILGDDTIVFYRGKDYVQPKVMSPIDTLSKKRAFEKSKYEQSLESVRRFIAIAEKELELYYRHIALYGDPNDRNPLSILEKPTNAMKESWKAQKEKNDLSSNAFSRGETEVDLSENEESTSEDDDFEGEDLYTSESDSTMDSITDTESEDIKN